MNAKLTSMLMAAALASSVAFAADSGSGTAGTGGSASQRSASPGIDPGAADTRSGGTMDNQTGVASDRSAGAPGASGAAADTRSSGSTGTGSETTGTPSAAPGTRSSSGTLLGPEGQQNSLERFDQNRDGYLGREEATTIPGLSDQWSRLDTNGDGRLDPAEFGHFNPSSRVK